MITIGARAHDFGTLPPEELAAVISAAGVSCIHLALAKAFRGVPTTPRELGPEGAHAIRDALAKKNLSVAILGCYINPVHPDLSARENALSSFEDHILAAADFGCRIVGTETGSVNANCSFHPLTATETTFNTLVDSIRRLTRAAEKTGPNGVIVGVEAVADVHTISSAPLMRRLLDQIDSPAIGVIFDPMNLVPRAGVPSQDAFLDECFSAFGDRIVAIHAKDYRMMDTGDRGRVKSEALPAGSGELDWVGLFRRLRSMGKDDVPVLLENAGSVDAPAAVARLREAWKRSAE